MQEETIKFLEKINKLLTKGNADLQVPVVFQRNLLGLDDVILSNLTEGNSKGIDIGCGNGSLVLSLRDLGFDIEGIDIKAPEKTYFIRQLIYGMKPMAGAIPRDDNSYDLVLAFQNNVLNRGFTIGGIIRDPSQWGGNRGDIDDHTRRLTYAQYIIYEGTRILKPGKRFVAYPQLRRLEDVMGLMLRMQGISFRHEEVDIDKAKEYIAWENQTSLGFTPDVPESYFEDWGLYHRTVLTKA